MKVGDNSAEIHSNSHAKGLHPQAQGLEPYQHVPYNKQHYRKVLLAMLHASCFIWMVKVATDNTRHKVNLRLPCVRRNWGKQRTAYHAVNDCNSLSQII